MTLAVGVLINGIIIHKDKQWSTKHYTENKKIRMNPCAPEGRAFPVSLMARVVFPIKKNLLTWKGRRQIEYISCHLWHKHYETVNQAWWLPYFWVMTSTYPLGTHGSVARFFAATICQENHIRKHDCWHIASTERFIFHMQVLL